MSRGLRARECNLSELLTTGTVLEMPPYQRSYSWGLGETSDLYNDLKVATETDESHFIGAVVLVGDETGTNQLIVDGQQRLTTLTMLACVLRDLETDADEADALHGIIADDGHPDGGPAWRLSLNHMDGAFFRESVQMRGAVTQTDIKPGDSESQTRMANNAAFMLAECRKLNTVERRKLARTLLTKVMLVEVIVDDWDDGYNVFRVLNARGKAPEGHDLIKTRLLERADVARSVADRYGREWSEYEATLSASGLNDLLNQIRVLHKWDSTAGPDEFIKHVIGRRGSARCREFLETELPAYVEAYQILSAGEASDPNLQAAIGKSLAHLVSIDHQLWRAPALRFLVNKNNSPAFAKRFFWSLERLAFAQMLLGTDRRTRQRRYDRVANEIDRGDQMFGSGGAFQLSSAERRRVTERLHGRFGSFQQRRAMAMRLNACLENGRVLRPEDKATVEHVLPRRIGDNSAWLTGWPDGEVRRELCETLGNFVLLSQASNQAADTQPFKVKQDIYRAQGSGHYALTADIMETLSWTPMVVRERTRKLAQILLNEWDLS